MVLILNCFPRSFSRWKESILVKDSTGLCSGKKFQEVLRRGCVLGILHHGHGINHR